MSPLDEQIDAFERLSRYVEFVKSPDANECSFQDDWLAFSPKKRLAAAVGSSGQFFYISIFYGDIDEASRLIAVVYPDNPPKKVSFSSEMTLVSTPASGSFFTETFDLEPVVLPYMVLES